MGPVLVKVAYFCRSNLRFNCVCWDGGGGGGSVPEIGVALSLLWEPDHNLSQPWSASWLPLASDSQLHVRTNTSNALFWMSIKVGSAVRDEIGSISGSTLNMIALIVAGERRSELQTDTKRYRPRRETPDSSIWAQTSPQPLFIKVEFWKQQQLTRKEHSKKRVCFVQSLEFKRSCCSNLSVKQQISGDAMRSYFTLLANMADDQPL